ncbi:hypothetical protein chiPu_0016346 [Chiloscyllium punctatum]|uniref:Uncharacterized protein n=1 Tax=Chiloscyllium punctatum TaxID=137246 RepID=A0A401T5B2_CHIPU|nr:hypothetical protein [Chiloscyllium punctatum]
MNSYGRHWSRSRSRGSEAKTRPSRLHRPGRVSGAGPEERGRGYMCTGGVTGSGGGVRWSGTICPRSWRYALGVATCRRQSDIFRGGATHSVGGVTYTGAGHARGAGLRAHLGGAADAGAGSQAQAQGPCTGSFFGKAPGYVHFTRKSLTSIWGGWCGIGASTLPLWFNYRAIAVIVQVCPTFFKS